MAKTKALCRALTFEMDGDYWGLLEWHDWSLVTPTRVTKAEVIKDMVEFGEINTLKLNWVK